MKREPGFYWVKYEGEWRIAFWDGRVEWSVHVVGDDLHYVYDSDFDEIHETRLIPPKPPKTR